MKYRIGHFYNPKDPPVPEAVMVEPATDKYRASWEVEIEDLDAFVLKYGPIILSPPGSKPYEEGWWIWVTDSSGRFYQK